jgi:hypothetical protein
MSPIPTSDNPFPIEAVATYGGALRTCEAFAYMQRCQGELNEYLIKYEKSETRYGCSIGLQGGHGSGKTHLLSWIGQRAGAFAVSKPIVLYAKADRASFFDLYTQILAQLKRADLQVAIAEAVRNIAIEEVNKATATKSIEKRLQTPSELQQLFHEENLDREALFLTLRDRLQVSGAPEEITAALLLIESPTLGERAHSWLSGKRIEDPESLGISYQLDALPISGETTSVPDAVAVNALETLAALFAVARRPVVILIDQLEVLLRTDAERRQTLSSMIKKLIEQLGRQHVLTFIAGTAEPWSLMPRDVAPRLRTREPLSVGVLEPDEASLLLGSFTPAEYSRETMTALMRITGGSPREILRVSHHVFRRANGSLGGATPDDIIECAKLAGTLDDRRRIALAEAEQVFAAIGTVLSDVDVGGELPVDRLLQIPSAPAIALIALTAADRTSEAKLARGLLSTLRKLNERWRNARIVVASLGYSTESIRQQLGRTAIVIEYAEGSFSRALQGVLAEAIKESGMREVATEADSLEAFQRISDVIENRLAKIEAQRAKETQKILEDFVAKAHIFAEPERERRELRTRWDVQEELGRLADGNQENPTAERESMRAVLVANEANIKNGRLDFLGTIYLDCLAPTYYYETARLRTDLLLEMRRVLRQSATSRLIFEHPWRAIAILSAAVAVFGLSVSLAPLYFGGHPLPGRSSVGMTLLIAATAAFYSAAGIGYTSFTWRSRWNRNFRMATRESRDSKPN